MTQLFHQIPVNDVDGIYEDLLSAYRGLSVEEQIRLSATLLICLSHRIGDRLDVQKAIDEAKAEILSVESTNVRKTPAN